MTYPYWVTSVFLGTASLLYFVGYFAHCFIVEGVTYTLHNADADEREIDEHAGYYGQALQMAAFAVMTMFAPALVDRFTPKKALLFTGGCFLVFFIEFLIFDEILYYVTQVFCGIGYAVFNVAEGAFIAELSTPETIDRFTTIETAISHGGQVLSGLVILGMHKLTDDPMNNIKVTYLGFAIFVFLGMVVVFHLLPSNAVAKPLAETVNSAQPLNARNTFLSTLYCLLLLIPLSIYQGFFTSFFLTVFPSSFSVIRHPDVGDGNGKKELVDMNISTTWIYCSCIGVGVILGGAILTVGASYMKMFITKFALWLHSILMIPAIVIIILSTPKWGFTQPSYSEETGSVLSVITVAICAGMCDCLITTVRSVLCQHMLPEHRLESFAVTRITQGLSSCVALILTPTLAVTPWCFILWAFLLIALLANFFIVRHLLKKQEQDGHVPIQKIRKNRCTYFG